MKNKIILLTGIISVVASTILGTSFGSIVNASNSVNSSDIEYEENLKNNWNMAVLSTDLEKIITDYYKITDRFKDTYPSYFGGMYINDDSTELIIQIVEKKIPKENSSDYEIYNKIINYDNRIKVEYVNFSFNELNKANNEISDIMTNDTKKVNLKTISNMSSKELKNNIIGTYIDVISNSVIVEVIDENNIQEQYLRTNILNNTENTSLTASNQIIKFKKGEEASPYIDLNAGSGIENGCSMGFRTKRNGAVGYVTAGHCVENKKMVESGLVLDYHFKDNDYYDYAFIQTNSNYNLTNKLAHTAKNITKLAVVDYCPILTEGLKIAKVGNKTKYTSGKITGLNQTHKFKKEDGSYVNLKGLVKSDLKADLGDSGGTVLIPKKDSDGGSVAIGVISGGGKSGFLNLSYTTYFTDINNMSMNLQARY